jgi:PilZ domain
MLDRRPISPLLAGRRIDTRAHVTISAELRKPGRTAFKICIRDLSRTGCRAETLTRTHEGEMVWLTLPGFAPIEGIIRWKNNRGFGLEWSAPLHPAVFDHIRQLYPEIFG